VTETERIKEKRKTTAWGRNGAREEKISYARGRISYRTQLGIGQRPEKFMEESKFQGSASARPNHCTSFFPLFAGEA